ncbi:MAG TPA: 2'-5' RNA ligase family protein [Terriglobales bacterium]|jgi:2'-5' RNA ligase
MPSRRYALVAYVKGPIAEFVEHLRKELHPDLPHLPAHITILPPRPLQGTEADAQATLDDLCKQVDPFDITLGDVDTFIPSTPTVFVRVSRGAYKLRELHDRLNLGPLAYKEEFPYMPHLTIVKTTVPDQADHAYATARERWTQFKGPHKVEVRELTFVREQAQYQWVDLAGIKLGKTLASARSH